MIEITHGLVDSDQVVTVGQIGLKDDSDVSIINAPQEANEEQVSDNASID